MNSQDNTTPATITVATPPADAPNWRGLTMEQLRVRRAKALVMREVEKVRINAALDNMRTRVSDNGIRGLMFSNNTIGRLKAADYMFLGWKIAQLFIKARRKR